MADLFSYVPPLKQPRPDRAYDGPEYDAKRDFERLQGQTQRVFDLMRDGNWRTLDAISKQTGDPHASISAQLRHLRKPKFGEHKVERQHLGSGLYQYRVIVNEAQP